MTMLCSNPEMLLYIGLADAYGAGVEYLKFPRDNAIKKDALRFERYIKHPTHDIQYAAYTDDTEMSIANARVLIEDNLPYCPLAFADAYVREFNRGGKRNGYARNFQQFLINITSGEEFLAKIQPYSRRNGAAMRSVPLGVLPNVCDVLAVAEMQARTTHNTREGILSAQAVALMSHFALYENTALHEVNHYCLEHLSMYDDPEVLQNIFTMPWSDFPVHQEPYGCEALTTIHAVVHLLTHETSLMRMLEQIVQWGGDTDSVAAITWGIASTRYRNEAVLPAFMTRDLEREKVNTGASYLVEIGTHLMEKFTIQ